MLIRLVSLLGFIYGFVCGFVGGLFGRRNRVTHTFASVQPRTKLLGHEGTRS